MLLARLWILTLPLFLFFFHHPIFTVADNFFTGDYPSDKVSVNKFICFDDYNHPSQAKASTPDRRKLVLAFGYENRIATGVIILITILNIFVFKLRQLHESKFGEKDNTLLLSSGQICRRFSLAEIQLATHNFDDQFVIGRGGFGKVYKGIIDNGVSTVAIKRLSSMSKQGGSEFWTEIEMLSKFRHSHLVSLIGYCDEWHEMILVYEYMSRGTLADHLHESGRKVNNSPLSWVQRLRICIGAARGLDYLHTGTSIQQRVIHRDVKSTNILLDENLAAKIADFGLSKIGPANQACTYVSTNVKGTFGYIDPQYFLTHRLTRKSDVYSFGVVLFEVLCGRRAVDLSLDEEQCGLVGWAQNCIKEGRVDQIIDSSLNMQIFPNSLLAFVKIADQCLHNRPKCRPTMAEIVFILEFALALQENTNSSQVDGAITNYHQNAHSSTAEEVMYGVYNMNQIKPFQMKHTRMAFTRKIRQFLAAPIRVISVHGNAKHSGYRKGNNNRVDNRVRLNNIGVVPVARGRIVTANLKMFTLAELKCATRNFSPDMLLGEGYCGQVFLGWVNEKTFAPSRAGHGMGIVIKRLNGCERHKDVQVDLYGKFHHPNFVKLLGLCSDDQEFILVYEYMQNGNLERYVYKDYAKPLSWIVWLKILIGAARFLAFLHTAEQEIICSNFKPCNILLDGDFNAKIVECGLVRFSPADGDGLITPPQVLDRSGYLSPEYVKAGHLSVKSDVYAFGVLLLEILTGMRVNDFDRSHKKHNLVDWTRPLLANKRNVKRIMNPKLMERGRCLEGAILSAVPALTLKCLDGKPENRPSMMEVLETLEEINTFTR